MKIAGVARALPPYRFTQQEIFEALAGQWRGKLENPALLSRFHQRVGVETRHMVMPLANYQDLTRWGDANRLWLENAEQLGEQAIDLALRRAGMERDRIGALLTVSVTGIASPSLDAHLANRMHLPLNFAARRSSDWDVLRARRALHRLRITSAPIRIALPCCSPSSCAH